jgi:hypothetical protein
MLLIYTQKVTPRITYIFKHICTRILGLEINLTSVIEDLNSYDGAKLSYGKKPMGNELFVQSYGLLSQQGFESEEILVRPWEDTKCFFSVMDTSALPFDIFSAGFYLLSRYEEYLPHVKDAQGRFPANESLAFKNDFLEQPVIDIWAYKFKQVLIDKFPSLLLEKKSMEIHSLVMVKQPFAFKQQGFFRSLIGFTNDLFKFKMKKIVERTSVVFGSRIDPYDTFDWIINKSKNKNPITFFFLLGDALLFEENINTTRQKFKMLVKYVADYKEVGLIFSYASLSNYELLKKEKKRIEEITNRTLEGSLNAELLVKLPENYRNLVELEVQKDFTMVYDDTPGFRAGTCTPFLFYDLDYEIKTPLIIHPLVATTSSFKDKYASDITKTMARLMNSVEQVNGTFSLLFTNKDFTPVASNEVWRNLFSDKLHADV